MNTLKSWAILIALSGAASSYGAMCKAIKKGPIKVVNDTGQEILLVGEVDVSGEQPVAKKGVKTYQGVSNYFQFTALVGSQKSPVQFTVNKCDDSQVVLTIYKKPLIGKGKGVCGEQYCVSTDKKDVSIDILR